jgi:hypothetical protein
LTSKLKILYFCLFHFTFLLTLSIRSSQSRFGHIRPDKTAHSSSPLRVKDRPSRWHLDDKMDDLNDILQDLSGQRKLKHTELDPFSSFGPDYNLNGITSSCKTDMAALRQ